MLWSLLFRLAIHPSIHRKPHVLFKYSHILVLDGKRLNVLVSRFILIYNIKVVQITDAKRRNDEGFNVFFYVAVTMWLYYACRALDPYPHLRISRPVPVPMKKVTGTHTCVWGMGILRVWVRVWVKIPTGYPCPTLVESHINFFSGICVKYENKQHDLGLDHKSHRIYLINFDFIYQLLHHSFPSTKISSTTLGLITNHTESISSTSTLSTDSSTTATPLLPVNLNLFLIRSWNHTDSNSESISTLSIGKVRKIQQ